MDVNVQYFRKNGYIICVKVGWIAVDIPRHWKIKKAECVGFSSQSRSSYYDIALNGVVCLHILAADYTDSSKFSSLFYLEQYPL